MDKVYSKNPEIVFRKIGDESILVPIKRHVTDLESIYTLNEVAARVWDLIDGTKSVSTIEEAIAAEFEVSPEEAGNDLKEFLPKLASAGIIR